MKIEGSNQPNLESVAAQRMDRATTDRAKQAAGAVTSQGNDRVQVSGDAALAAKARRLADEAPDIRHDLVDRMRAKLAAGEIGKDAERLADKMIDDMIGQ
jgi:flagellar biosynthesis anti-sigma factor FlgM